MDFDKAFAILTDDEHEGGYTPGLAGDPGGETKYGISKRSYPAEDITNLTLARAKELYLRDFWGPAGCDAWPDAIKYQMFDLAVNTCARGNAWQAIRILQRAVGTVDDGKIGPQTMMKVQNLSPDQLRRRLSAKIIRFYASLQNFPRFGKGWMNRLATNMEMEQQ